MNKSTHTTINQVYVTLLSSEFFLCKKKEEDTLADFQYGLQHGHYSFTQQCSLNGYCIPGTELALGMIQD